VPLELGEKLGEGWQPASVTQGFRAFSRLVARLEQAKIRAFKRFWLLPKSP
jgi:hypothetical protein